MDSRACTPDTVRVAVHLAVEVRSFERAAKTMRTVLGHSVSAKTMERLVGQIGPEMRAWQESFSDLLEILAPEVAVLSCDGGRARTRAMDSGPGVHAAKWRETKNASFEKMLAPEVRGVDPCPALPDTFRLVGQVAKIAEKAAFSVASAAEDRPRYEGPERVLRTCLSSLECSQEFGLQMRREAQRRKFDAAPRRVFIGDGLGWNWAIWKEHFPTYTPILDFIHAVQYLYAAAAAWETTDEARWRRYLSLTEAVWQGRVDDVVGELKAELQARGIDPGEKTADDSPHEPLVSAARYLTNNRERMDYPRYRREGLPITSSPMESLIKQINNRVKGTEMFWNDPAGAEAILQVRAALLSEDERLDRYLRQRPGCALTRRPTPAIAA